MTDDQKKKKQPMTAHPQQPQMAQAPMQSPQAPMAAPAAAPMGGMAGGMAMGMTAVPGQLGRIFVHIFQVLFFSIKDMISKCS